MILAEDRREKVKGAESRVLQGNFALKFRSTLGMGVSTMVENDAVLKQAKVIVVGEAQAESDRVASWFAHAGYMQVKTGHLRTPTPMLEAENPALVVICVPQEADCFSVFMELGLSPESLVAHPSIVVSAGADNADRLRAYGAGAFAYITQPTDPMELLLVARTAIRSAITVQHLEREHQLATAFDNLPQA